VHTISYRVHGHLPKLVYVLENSVQRPVDKARCNCTPYSCQTLIYYWHICMAPWKYRGAYRRQRVNTEMCLRCITHVLWKQMVSVRSALLC